MVAHEEHEGNGVTDERACRAYLRRVAEVAEAVPLGSVTALRALVARTVERGGTLFTAGNGGSATVAEHLALGMSLNVFRETGSGFRSIALSSGTYATAAANDFGRERMFSAQLQAMAREGDMFVAVSASGCSENLVSAMRCARQLGVRTGAIVGKDGPIAADADVPVLLRAETSAIAEDVTIQLLHWLYCSFMEKRA